MNAQLDLPYFPRPKLLDSVMTALTTGLTQGISLFAPRRQGKTMFVKHELIPGVEQKYRWRTLYIDLWEFKDDPEWALVNALERECKAKGLTKALQVDKVNIKAKPPGAEIGMDLTRVANDIQPSLGLQNRLHAALDALMAKDAPLLLIFDEFQALAGAKSDAFVAALRTAFQKHKGKLLLFYTGSSRRELSDMFHRAKAPLFESATPMTLPPLDKDFVIDRALWLKERTGWDVDIDQLDVVFDRLGRVPEYLNALLVAMLIAGSPDIESALKDWFNRQHAEDITNRLHKLKPLPLAVLNCVANKPDMKLFGAAAREFIAELIGDESVSSPKIQTAVNTLVKNDYLTATGDPGSYAVENVLMLEYLKNNPMKAITGE